MPCFLSYHPTAERKLSRLCMPIAGAVQNCCTVRSEGDLSSYAHAGEMYVSWVTGDYVFSATSPTGPPPITVASKVPPPLHFD